MDGSDGSHRENCIREKLLPGPVSAHLDEFEGCRWISLGDSLEIEYRTNFGATPKLILSQRRHNKVCISETGISGISLIFPKFAGSRTIKIREILKAVSVHV
jgi:hypothetical protein